MNKDLYLAFPEAGLSIDFSNVDFPDGHLDAMASRADEALASLKQAQALAADLGHNEHSELAKAIAETAGLLGVAVEPALGAEEDDEDEEEDEERAFAILEGERLLE